MIIILVFSLPIFSFSQTNKLDSTFFLIEDYSNRKQTNISAVYADLVKLKEEVIVVLNSKIVSIDDESFVKLDKSAIKRMEIIKDDESKSTIKIIMLIETK